MQIVLIAGLWLPRTVWAEVAADLENKGHRVHAVALPGVDDVDRHATLGDQITAVVDIVDAASGQAPGSQSDAEHERGPGAGEPVVVVGHSAASALAWIAADRRPATVAGVVMVGGFPVPDDQTYAAFFPVVAGVVPFPGWEPFAGADSVDLDEDVKARMEAIAVPVPAGVAGATVQLTDEARYRVPITLICPEYSAQDAESWIQAGELPELASAEAVTAVDIDSGHWPMLTRPAELAALIDEAASAV